MADLFMGIDPGVELAYVLMNAGGTVLDYAVQKFPPRGDALRCSKVWDYVWALIIESFTTWGEGGRLHVGVEVEVTTRPYYRRIHKGAQVGVMRTLATHNQIVGATLAAASIRIGDNLLSTLHQVTPAPISKRRRSTLAAAAGFVPAGIAASRLHHLTDAWFVADTLRRQLADC